MYASNKSGEFLVNLRISMLKFKFKVISRNPNKSVDYCGFGHFLFENRGFDSRAEIYHALDTIAKAFNIYPKKSVKNIKDKKNKKEKK